MAKKKRKRRVKRGFPILTVISFLPPVLAASGVRQAGAQAVGRNLVASFTGVILGGDNKFVKWDPMRLVVGYGGPVALNFIKQFTRGPRASISRLLPGISAT